MEHISNVVEVVTEKTMNEKIKMFAQDALEIQNACNLSVVVHSFSRVMHTLREFYPGKGTDWYNRHPIAVMYSSKISSLTGSEENFSKAYTNCADLADGRTIEY